MKRKKMDFQAKIRILGPKKHTLLDPNHVLATTGQSCAKEKVPVFRFSAKRKNGRFSVIPAGTGSVVIVGYFLGGPDGPTKFR